mgnify:CR=1 FL=1
MPKANSIKDAYKCLNIGRYAVAWGALGIAEECYETALKFSLERTQFGEPIAGKQLIQKKLADICPSIEIFVDHIEYVINKIGIDYIAQTQLPKFDQNPDYLDERKREDFLRNNKLRLLRDYQLKSVKAVQSGISEGKDRFLLEMATGTGKTLISSAIIKTSEGPAIMSMPTLPKTCRFASATKALPGPVILFTGEIVSVPYAKAAIACAPPTLKISVTPEIFAAKRTNGLILP